MQKTDYTPPARSCGTCHYFDKMVNASLASVNVCRLKPGAVIGGWMGGPDGQPKPLSATCWPMVDPLTDWCGEHKPKLNG